MKRLLATVGILFSFQSLIHAQTPTLQDFDKLLNFGEGAFSELLSPQTTSTQTEAVGSTWFYRDYGYLSPIPGGSGLAVAVNVSGGGGFSAGDVYAIGGAYGSDPVLVDTLTNLLTLVPESPATGNESRIIEPGNGNCVNRKRLSAGSNRGFEENVLPLTRISSGATATISNEMQVRDRGGRDIYVSEMLTDGANTVTDRFTSVSNDLLFLDEVRIDHTEYFPSNGNQYAVTTTYNGGLFLGPASSVCEGQQWFSAPVTKSVVTSPPSNSPGSFTEQTLGTTTTVDSVSEAFTPPLLAVTSPFTTIKTTATNEETITERWVDIGSGILVNEEVRDQGGSLISRKRINFYSP